MSFMESAFFVCDITKVGARSGDPMAEVRWVKICHKRCCDESEDERFENKHREDALKRPERGVELLSRSV
jgi:hypothetical protein